MSRIIGWLGAGVLVAALAADNETTRLLADFGVVFLVFTLGLEFSLPRLVAMRSKPGKCWLSWRPRNWGGCFVVYILKRHY